MVASLNPRVVDGTTCYRGIRNICIGGICREIPCDLNMESNAIEDACGVCKGNGTSCSLKSYTTTIVQASRECDPSFLLPPPLIFASRVTSRLVLLVYARFITRRSKEVARNETVEIFAFIRVSPQMTLYDRIRKYFCFV